MLKKLIVVCSIIFLALLINFNKAHSLSLPSSPRLDPPPIAGSYQALTPSEKKGNNLSLCPDDTFTPPNIRFTGPPGRLCPDISLPPKSNLRDVLDVIGRKTDWKIKLPKKKDTGDAIVSTVKGDIGLPGTGSIEANFGIRLTNKDGKLTVASLNKALRELDTRLKLRESFYQMVETDSTSVGFDIGVNPLNITGFKVEKKVSAGGDEYTIRVEKKKGTWKISAGEYLGEGTVEEIKNAANDTSDAIVDTLTGAIGKGGDVKKNVKKGSDSISIDLSDGKLASLKLSPEEVVIAGQIFKKELYAQLRASTKKSFNPKEIQVVMKSNGSRKLRLGIKFASDKSNKDSEGTSNEGTSKIGSSESSEKSKMDIICGSIRLTEGIKLSGKANEDFSKVGGSIKFPGGKISRTTSGGIKVSNGGRSVTFKDDKMKATVPIVVQRKGEEIATQLTVTNGPEGMVFEVGGNSGGDSNSGNLSGQSEEGILNTRFTLGGNGNFSLHSLKLRIPFGINGGNGYIEIARGTSEASESESEEGENTSSDDSAAGPKFSVSGSIPLGNGVNVKFNNSGVFTFNLKKGSTQASLSYSLPKGIITKYGYSATNNNGERVFFHYVPPQKSNEKESPIVETGFELKF